MFARRKNLSVIISTLMSSALLTLVSGNAVAQSEDTNSTLHYSDVEEIVVRALPLGRTRLQSAQPVDVMVGETLADRRGMTLGETLQQQPGVQSSFYGAGSGRPIIRGLSGPRVRILEDGLATADTSTQSDDHAVTVDPLLIDQIEILRGPATLLYGSAASAGVVNIIDGRIPEQRAEEPLSGRFEIRGDNVADERSGVLRLDGGAGNIAWHLDGSWREADDYRIPGEARFAGSHEDHDHEDDDHEDEHDEGEHNESGSSNRLFNSFVESQSGTAGLSWIGDNSFVGGSFRAFNSVYGIPAPHFHAEEEHDEAHDEDDHEAHAEEEEFAYIDMEQRSWDIKAGLMSPLPGIRRATVRVGYNDYTHSEIELGGALNDEHDDDHEDDDHADHEHGDGTVFDVQTLQSRLSFETTPVWGWEGAFGLQLEQEEFKAEGAEAFVPDNKTRSIGVFVLQERQFDALTLSLGARVENTKVHLQGDAHAVDHDHDDEQHDGHDDDHGAFADIDSRTFRNVSASIGGIYEFNETWQTSVNFSRVQRAPSQTELFANGPHLATFSYEEGNAGLRTETAKAWDLTLHRHADFFDFEISVFRKDVADFIYLATTDEEELGFPVREAEQQDAEFTGMEVQGVWQLFTSDWGHFDLHAGYDRVHAKLADNSYLPRISPERVSAGLDWHLAGWRGGLDVYRMMKQDKVPALETTTPGYTMVNLRIAYEFDIGNSTLEAFAQGRNLGNQEARVATSYLRDFAPLPGRNVIVGIRGRF
ncbi:hypothetical protein PHACT_01095 [Pseudohongiella acticola]|uniref:TonB-dependent receptor n=1 Tax=Pseudohongiella acticola TaxID=1524254 RepID=A0A1E8CHM9_9GAMM|nr:TonB-dependent receptor [Pseudohongiella acticola]OFE11909.1 hypothetical protein PHACT_01095 [Pseudohongiella acticola]